MAVAIKTWATSNQKELTRFLKFAVVGIIGAVVDFGVLYLMHIVLGLPLLIANVISFSTAVISNFTWNRYWTYPDSRSKPLGAQLGQFISVNLIGLALNTGLLLLFRPLFISLIATLSPTLTFLAQPETAYNIAYNLAKAGATGVVMFWNFFVNRVWTYNDVK